MGKGLIKADLGDGKYKVQLVHDRGNLDSQIANLQAKIADPGTSKIVKAACERRLEYIQNNAPSEDPVTDAWCADLTEGLSGEVETAEVYANRIEITQIRPGYGDGSAYNQARGGMLQRPVASSPEAVYFNRALYPAWQKWRPHYRHGTIMAKNDDGTVNIRLDGAYSSEQTLYIDAKQTFENVPVYYMTCGAEAFEEFDNVLIEFINRDKDNPAVIGFRDNPKSCDHWEDWRGPFGNSKNPWNAELLTNTGYILKEPWNNAGIGSGSYFVKLENERLKMKVGPPGNVLCGVFIRNFNSTGKMKFKINESWISGGATGASQINIEFRKTVTPPHTWETYTIVDGSGSYSGIKDIPFSGSSSFFQVNMFDINIGGTCYIDIEWIDMD